MRTSWCAQLSKLTFPFAFVSEPPTPAKVRSIGCASTYFPQGDCSVYCKRSETCAGRGECAAAPLPDPRTFVAWNADSLLTRVKKNASELGAFLAALSANVPSA